MRAAILAVGNELLGSERVDTNSLQLAELLARYGVGLSEKAVVGDNLEAIAAAIARQASDNELVLVTGGLGPTQDDLTREGAARALGLDLIRRPEVVEEIGRKFARFGMEMPPVNAKQGDVLAGAEILANERGTAPGQLITVGRTAVFLFPGVPTELEGIAAASLEPWLVERSSGERLERVVLKVACLPESTLEQRLQPFYERWGEEGVALLPSAGQVTIRLEAAGRPVERRAWLEPRSDALRELLGDRIFGEVEDATLEGAVAVALEAGGLTVATAESCTGGLVAERLTRVPGSSSYYLGSVVTYADQAKTNVLGVQGELLQRHGAVSAEVAAAMADGVRRMFEADLGVAVTGIAGPGGGSELKPVGTVHVALHGPGPERGGRLLRLPGDRERVRWMTSQWALEMLRRGAVEASAGAEEGR